ncbi:shootin-1-like [Rhineura floridana]|uniref:shootin-1-like n=1 Tax=Rhineura floridana TaxID=261503 RepID=UPI002AC83D75|nr:shootin-1-like [Rhineura floridana]
MLADQPSAQTRMEHLEVELSQLEAILESSDSDADSEEDEESTEAALLQEQDQAKEKLAEFEHASQALLAELSTLEAEFAIEKSCREQAEAYAAQINRENQKLKRFSAALLPVLSHLPADFINRGEEDEAPNEPALDPVCPYRQQIKDLRAKVSQLLDEKKELAMQVRELQGHAQQLQEQVEEEYSEKQSLQALMEESQRALKRVKQVSRLLTEEYGKVSQQLNLEEELRQQAETFAHQMLVKQKEASRQSMILMENISPEAQLLQALDEVAKTTQALEVAKEEHQAKVKDLEAQLVARPPLEELHRLLSALAMAEEEKVCLRKRLLQVEERNAALEERVKSLEEQAKMTESPSPETCPVAPPPPPPPPLPLPACPAPVDPLMAIRQRKGAQQVKCGKPCADDTKAKAVEEMMARIKSGVVLRPARKDAGALSKLPSTTASNRRSTVMELQGLLAQSTMRRPVRKSSRRKGSQLKLTDNQLESILQRRRCIVDCPAQAQVLQQQSTAATEHSLPIEARGAVVGAHSIPDVGVPGKPSPAMQSSKDPTQSLTGDPCKPVAKIPPCSEEEEEPASAQFQARIASLQRSRRISPTSGAGESGLTLMQRRAACMSTHRPQASSQASLKGKDMKTSMI